MVRILCAGVLLTALGVTTQATAAPTLQWGSQFIDENWTGRANRTHAVSVDGLGHIYVTGGLNQNSNLPSDVFVRKYDMAGNVLWNEQYTSAIDSYASGASVSADRLGNVFIGGNNSLGDSGFASAYDAAGNHRWTRSYDVVGYFNGTVGAAADGLGNVYVAGWTGGAQAGPAIGGSRDSFLYKYDSAGNTIWSRQFGTTTRDWTTGVAVDGQGNAFVSGYGDDDIGVVTKYDADGNQVWRTYIPSQQTSRIHAVAADSAGNTYVTGYTSGPLADMWRGNGDVWIGKFSPTGSVLWLRQYGTGGWDVGESIAVDQLGGIYISGYSANTGGPFSDEDVVMLKYDTSGNQIWVQKAFSSDHGHDHGWGVAADRFGNLITVGGTRGSLYSANPNPPNANSDGQENAFVGFYSDVPRNATVTAGGGATGSIGNGLTGGVDYNFVDVTSNGTLGTSYAVTDPDNLDAFLPTSALPLFTFQLPGDHAQIWNLTFDGVFAGATITFHYDESLLGGTDEDDLEIRHFKNGVWEAPANQFIDVDANTITFLVDAFSPFVLTEFEADVEAVPEPSTFVLAALGLAGLGLVAFRRMTRRAG